MREINIKVIPHCCQRYETPGDYWIDKEGVLQVRISRMGNRLYEFLVLFHELLEWFMCEQAGIPIKDIDAFDIKYEKERDKGLHSKFSEPGNHPKAPYGFAHRFATKMERIVADKLRVRWEFYSLAVSALHK